MCATKPWFRFAPLWECLIEIIVCLTLSCTLLILIFVFLRKMAYIYLLWIFAFLCQSPRYSAIKQWPHSLAVMSFMIAGGWVKRHYITVALLIERAAVLTKPGKKKGYRSQAFTSFVRLNESIIVRCSFVGNAEGVLDTQLQISCWNPCLFSESWFISLVLQELVLLQLCRRTILVCSFRMGQLL